MKHPLSRLRVGVVLLFLFGILSPVAIAGVGAQDLTCDDFTSERAAQAVLDADPDMAETLDPDGDGIACNHEEDASDDGAADAADDEADATDDEADAADDEADAADDGTGGGDADAYLGDVADQAAEWSDSLDELLDIDPLQLDLPQEDVDAINAIITDFLEAPDVAAEFEVPEGLEDVQTAFEDLADGYADIADTLIEWSETEIDSPEEADAEDAYADALDAVADLNDDLTTAIEDAGGSTADGSDDTADATDDEEDATDDAADDGSDDGTGGDAESYLADITEVADAWEEGFTTLEDLNPLGGGLSDAEADEVIEIFDTFQTAPDTAAEFEAPEGLEDVQAAFEDLADGYADIGLAFSDWAATDAGSAEEADAEDAYDEAMDAVIDLQDEFALAVEDAGGASDGADDGASDESDATDDGADDEADATDDAADDGSDDGSGGDAEVTEYLEAVADHNTELIDGATRLIEILGAEEITDADRDDLAALLALWAEAPDVAAGVDVPDGMEDVQAEYEDVADAYATTADNFNAWLETDPEDEAASDEAWTAFTDSLAEATELSATLDETIADAG